MKNPMVITLSGIVLCSLFSSCPVPTHCAEQQPTFASRERANVEVRASSDPARLFLAFAEPKRALKTFPEAVDHPGDEGFYWSLLVWSGEYERAYEFLSENEAVVPAEIAGLCRGYLLWKAGRGEDARRELADYREMAPPELAPIATALGYLASVPSSRSEIEEAMSVLRNELPAGLRGELRELLHQKLSQELDEDPALYLDFIGVLRDSEGVLRDGALLVSEAEALLRLGEGDASRWILSDLLHRIDDPEQIERIIEIIMSTYGPMLTPAERLTLAEAMQVTGQFEPAAAQLEDLMRDPASEKEEKERARILSAKNLYLKKRYRTAARVFADLEDELELTSSKAECALYVARAHYSSRRHSLSQEAYVRFARTYPEHPMAGEALYVSARRFDIAGDTDRAMELYREYLDAFSGGEYARDALLSLGLGYYLKGDHDNAVAYLTSVAVGSGTHQQEAATYWLARAESEAGREVEAKRWAGSLTSRYPDSFYHRFLGSGSAVDEGEAAPGSPQRLQDLVARIDSARARLGEAIETGALARYVRNRSPRGEETARFERGVKFLEIGFVDLALGDLVPLESAWGRRPDLLIKILDEYLRFGLANRVLHLVTRLSYLIPAGERQQFRDSIRPLFYPVAYYPTVLDVAEELDLDPDLILAIIREESWFDYEAKSAAGAWGLMQLMPPTGRQMADALGVSYREIETLTEPHTNIRLGSRYVENLKRRYDGEEVYVLISYNGGPARMNRWFRNHGAPDDLPLFVDTLEFRETRRYVKRVLRSRRIYQSLVLVGPS